MSEGTPAPAPRSRPTLTGRFIAWAAGFEDGQILRAAFFGMLAATICVLAIDFIELSARDAANSTAAATAPTPGAPILPAFDPNSPQGSPGPAVTTDPALLRQPLAFDLVAGGVLKLTGTIDPGAGARFAQEIAARGEYVKTVALDSPGGSVEDAMAIGRLIRDKGFATSVAAGALCASSCPLILAGGKQRVASAKAAIGVHQVYSVLPARTVADTGRDSADAAMSEAQSVTARITRYLTAMGIDPAIWLDAMETPPDRLHYFFADELVAHKLVTNINH